MQKVVQTFIELVKIDSPSGHEGEVRKYVAGRLKGVRIRSSIDKAGNLFAKIEGQGEPVLLCAHMDTVEPGRSIKPVIKNGIIKSDGSTILGADNKVAVAAILEALSEVEKSKRRVVEIIFSVREETDSGICEFDFKKLKSKVGINADKAGPLGEIIMASPWIEQHEMKVIGKTSHSAYPEKAINALKIASNVISQLDMGKVNKNTTYNIGKIKGGTVSNAVCGQIDLVGEVRSFSKGSLYKQSENVKTAFEKEASKLGAKIEYKGGLYCAGYKFRKSDRAIEETKSALKKVGLKPKYAISFGGSDVNELVKNGIRVVNISDGSKDSHTTKESISVKNLVKLKDFFVSYITV